MTSAAAAKSSAVAQNFAASRSLPAANPTRRLTQLRPGAAAS
jgi:hypothetical protein